MTPQEAQTSGKTKALKTTGINVPILLVVFMFSEAGGDFANGILFFLQAILNIRFIVVLTILFGLTYLYGRFAGKEIILDKKSFLMTSLKYRNIIILPTFTYTAIIGIAKTMNIQVILFKDC